MVLRARTHLRRSHVALRYCWMIMYTRFRGFPEARRWNWVTGPISALICMLLGIGWAPHSVDLWVSPSGQEYVLDFTRPMQIIVDEVLSSLMSSLWTSAALSWNGSGLAGGGPHPASLRLLHRLRRLHASRMASLLETILVGGVWLPDRASDASFSPVASCPWCSCAGATQLHVVYECPCSSGCCGLCSSLVGCSSCAISS